VEEQKDGMGLQEFYAVQESQFDAGYAPDYAQLADDAEEMWEE